MIARLTEILLTAPTRLNGEVVTRASAIGLVAMLLSCSAPTRSTAPEEVSSKPTPFQTCVASTEQYAAAAGKLARELPDHLVERFARVDDVLHLRLGGYLNHSGLCADRDAFHAGVLRGLTRSGRVELLPKNPLTAMQSLLADADAELPEIRGADLVGVVSLTSVLEQEGQAMRRAHHIELSLADPSTATTVWTGTAELVRCGSPPFDRPTSSVDCALARTDASALAERLVQGMVESWPAVQDFWIPAILFKRTEGPEQLSVPLTAALETALARSGKVEIVPALTSGVRSSVAWEVELALTGLVSVSSAPDSGKERAPDFLLALHPQASLGPDGYEVTLEVEIITPETGQPAWRASATIVVPCVKGSRYQPWAWQARGATARTPAMASPPFSSVAGVSRGDGIADVHTLLGAPETAGENRLDYFDDGLTFWANARTNRIVAIDVESTSVIAQLKRLGIASPELSLLGATARDAESALGPPESWQPNEVVYTLDHTTVILNFSGFAPCICSELHVLWSR